jgi:hypothetical protein
MATLSWRQEIPATEPVSKYENVVENILRDKASGWSSDYYRDTSTGYDVHVSRAQGEIQKHRVQINKYEKALEKITQALDASEHAKAGPEGKKLSAKEVAALELEYTETYKLKCEQMVLLDAAESKFQGLQWKQYLQRKRLSLLQALRNDFILEGNEDYMRRGVTWIEEYIRKLRESSL